MDRHPPIGLEVTVPRIVLPSLTGTSTQDDTEKVGTSVAQVRLLPVEADTSRRSLTPPVVADEASTYTTRTGLFHLFRLKATPEQGRAYLLQILRPRKIQPQTRAVQEDIKVTDELVFTLEYRHTTENDPAYSTHTGLIPGQHHVVIVLNEDDMPGNCTVDGAEG